MTPAGFDPVLITGASGFVGACVARAALARGHAVHVLLRDPARAWRLADVKDQLTVHQADLIDAASVGRCLASARPRVVLHLATHGAYESQAEARTILDANIVGILNLLQAAESHGAELVVQTGSSSEYGFRSDPMCETDRLEPNSVYAVAKAAQSHLGSLWSQRTSLAVVCLRLFSIYGPWEEPTRLIPTLIRKARAGLPIDMVSPDIARDLVYVDDICDAMLDFPRLRAQRGEIINLGSGQERTMREVVDTVQRIVGTRSPVRWNAFPARRWDAKHWCADASKAEEKLGWRAQHSLFEGLRKTADWMQTIGDDYGLPRIRHAG
jgi:nucleoside-diphosphate-sugar epimerase